VIYLSLSIWAFYSGEATLAFITEPSHLPTDLLSAYTEEHLKVEDWPEWLNLSEPDYFPFAASRSEQP
jgi:hypothetical protein